MPSYLDEDVAYLLGLIVARGEFMTTENVHKLTVKFPNRTLIARGLTTAFDVQKEILLGLEKVRERLVELLSADVRTVSGSGNIDLVVRSTRNTLAWRNLRLLMRGETNIGSFQVPQELFAPDVPRETKREFIRGFADAAGNVRPANRDQAGRHRVRLDIQNRTNNWKVPVDLCLLLQEQLGVPVPVITWGHPNLGRGFREHQLNIYAEEFVEVGFYFDYKQKVLEELAEKNNKRFLNPVRGCPGERLPGTHKSPDLLENSQKLDLNLRGHHFDWYWQICRAIGCPRRPQHSAQLELIPEVL